MASAKWVLSGASWYFLGASGAMATGWHAEGGIWYFLDGSGRMATGWKAVGSTWYYFDPKSQMATGWRSVGGTWYYLYSSGAMAASTWVGGYYLQGDGAMATAAASASASASTSASSSSSAVAPTDAWTCPASHPIKGNKNSRLYHMPSSKAYKRTKPEACYAHEIDAVNDGYTKAKG